MIHLTKSSILTPFISRENAVPEIHFDHINIKFSHTNNDNAEAINVCIYIPKINNGFFENGSEGNNDLCVRALARIFFKAFRALAKLGSGLCNFHKDHTAIQTKPKSFPLSPHEAILLENNMHRKNLRQDHQRSFFY